MKLENNSSAFNNESDFIRHQSNGHFALENIIAGAGLNTGIHFQDDQKKKLRLLSILQADIKWAINSEGKVSYFSPFEDNCIGNDAKLLIKQMASKYLTPSSVLSCLIELEELKEIMRTFKNTQSRRQVIELLPNESNIEKIEISCFSVFDSKGNVVGIEGLCNFIS